MAVAEMVARYYLDASAAVADWRAMIEAFDNIFTLGGGNPFADLEDDSPVEPYHYCVTKGCGNLAGGALAESIRQYVRAVQRVAKYVSTDRLERVDLKLLEDWASEIDFAFSFAQSSEKLVDLSLRVNQAFETFAEDVDCHLAIQSIESQNEKPRSTNASVAASTPIDELRIKLAAGFLKNPPEVFWCLSNLVDEALEFLEWKDVPGTDVSCTYLSPGVDEENVRDWFNRFSGFLSGITLAVSRTSAELREYLVGQFVEADPEKWTRDGKKILHVKGLPESVIWAEIQSHGILPSKVWYGLQNMRAAMFRGLEQERGTPILLSDDPEELSNNYGDVVAFMCRLRDRLFLDDALNRELKKIASQVVADTEVIGRTNASSRKVGPPQVGPDQSEYVFRWKGRTVEGFTPTGLDVLKAMWEMLNNAEHRVRRTDVATFLPDRMATWDYDPNLKNFSKYQTEIRKAFEAAKMPFPWEFNARTKYYVKSDVYREVDDR